MLIYPPTKQGSEEMFSDYEKEIAYDNMIDMEIDDIKEEKHKRQEQNIARFENIPINILEINNKKI